MTLSIDLSQELLAIDMLTDLKSCLEHNRKYVLRSLQLYGENLIFVPSGRLFQSSGSES